MSGINRPGEGPLQGIVQRLLDADAAHNHAQELAGVFAKAMIAASHVNMASAMGRLAKLPLEAQQGFFARMAEKAGRKSGDLVGAVHLVRQQIGEAFPEGSESRGMLGKLLLALAGKDPKTLARTAIEAKVAGEIRTVGEAVLSSHKWHQECAPKDVIEGRRKHGPFQPWPDPPPATTDAVSPATSAVDEILKKRDLEQAAPHFRNHRSDAPPTSMDGRRPTRLPPGAKT